MAKKHAVRSASDDRPLGRNTPATMAVFSDIAATVPAISPGFVRGTLPRRSPGTIRFIRGQPGGEADEQDQAYYQVRGFCTGWATAHVAECEAGSPDRMDIPEARWARPERYSPGYSYALGRMLSAQLGDGLSPREDGGIVGRCVQAAGKYGFLPWSAWPSDPKHEQAQLNNQYPTKEQMAEAATHAPASFVMLRSADEVRDQLLTGRFVGVGTPWLLGMHEPEPLTGKATVTGQVIGGHAYALVWLDLDLDTLVLLNSHPKVGYRFAPGNIDPPPWLADVPANRFAAADGYTNLVSLPASSYFGKLFSSTMMRQGQSEAYVWSDVGGLRSRIGWPPPTA